MSAGSAFSEALRNVREITDQSRAWVVGHRRSDLPRPELTPGLAAKWLVDEWALQFEVVTGMVRRPDLAFRRRLRDELGDAVDLYNERGYVDDPRPYHADPTPMGAVELRRRRTAGLDYDHLTTASEYEPLADDPGRERWMDYEKNRTAHAWILEHPGGPRPWLMCINGYRTGNPQVDLRAFNARYLHHTLGLNLAFPVQPLHGPRAEGRSGDRVLHGGAMNLIHTGAHGLWDLRRLKAWLQTERGATQVGAMGISLGGYFTALLAGYEDDLACAIAGVPEADLIRGMRRNFEPRLPPHFEQWGLSWRSLERAHRVVSPLHVDSLVPHDRRYIFAGLVDRWVRPGNVHALWEHWEQPAICWYDGAHLSFPFERDVRRFVDGALEQSFDSIGADLRS